MNLEPFRQYLLSKGYSNNTSGGYVKDVRHFIAWCEKENIPVHLATYSDVLYYLQGLKQRVQQSTVFTYMNSVRHYYNYLQRIGEVEDNPVRQVQLKGIKCRKLHHILTRAELESLYHHFKIPVGENNPVHKVAMLSARRNRIILGLMVYQGLTTRELNRLDKKDLKLHEGTIYISSTRQSNERTLKLEAHQIMDFMEYLSTIREGLLQLTRKESEKLLISSGSGNQLQNTIQKLMADLGRQNPKVKNLQQIRASVITHWLKLYNLRQVQYMAGHRYISSTEAYLINDLDGLQVDIDKYHPIG